MNRKDATEGEGIGGARKQDRRHVGRSARARHQFQVQVPVLLRGVRRVVVCWQPFISLTSLTLASWRSMGTAFDAHGWGALRGERPGSGRALPPGVRAINQVSRSGAPR